MAVNFDGVKKVAGEGLVIQLAQIRSNAKQACSYCKLTQGSLGITCDTCPIPNIKAIMDGYKLPESLRPYVPERLACDPELINL